MTTDSEPGWLPSEDETQRARKTVLDYLAASDEGRMSDAYALLAESGKQNESLADFSKRIRDFNTKAGPVKARDIVTVTWTKDPAHAPAPGVYAAFDLVSKFERIDRHCGYLVVFQPPGGQFAVSREESNFLDNATAQSIEKQHSRAEVDAAWASLSAHCPNYSPTGSPVIPTPAPALPPLTETPGSDTGYPTVAVALQGLRSKPGAVFATQAGWTVVEDRAESTFWSFPPPGHPAYPAAVKRTLSDKNGAVFLNMTVQCEASKQACDDLVRSFQALNARMTAELGSRH